MRILLSFISLISLSFTPHLHAASWQSNDYILSSFNKIALNGAKLKKWQTPIYYQITHHVDDIELHEKIVSTHLNQLHQITGLQIQPADSLHKANLIIVLTDEKQFHNDVKHYFKLDNSYKIQAISDHKLGATSLLTTKDGTIKQSTVIIPTDRARAYARLLTSFSEMLTKAVGMQYRSVDVFPSIFNQRSIDSYLTGLDYVMLKLLYDKRIKPSMNNRSIQQLAQSIIKENTYQDYIYEASLTVKQSGLNTLLN